MNDSASANGRSDVTRPRGPEAFEAIYAGTPPWDIGRPQGEFQALADAGRLQGRALDVGCGTGEHALMAAGLGLDATGIDLSATAIGRAERKASERGLSVRFAVGDACDMGFLGEEFDTALDCGLFHVLTDEDRPPVRRQPPVRRPGRRRLPHALLQRPRAGRPRAPSGGPGRDPRQFRRRVADRLDRPGHDRARHAVCPRTGLARNHRPPLIPAIPGSRTEGPGLGRVEAMPMR